MKLSEDKLKRITEQFQNFIIRNNYYFEKKDDLVLGNIAEDIKNKFLFDAKLYTDDFNGDLPLMTESSVEIYYGDDNFLLECKLIPYDTKFKLVDINDELQMIFSDI